MKILVADDNPINIKVARYALEKWGAIIEEATDGNEAITKFKTDKFDVIFLDMQMPNMD